MKRIKSLILVGMLLVGVISANAAQAGQPVGSSDDIVEVAEHEPQVRTGGTVANGGKGGDGGQIVVFDIVDFW
jgi:hypothetical protein